MKILVIYFARMLGYRILSVLLAFVALLVLMDLIDNVDGVLERRGNVADVFIFAGYRLPTIVERVIPLSVLIGSTLGVYTLASHSELVAIRAAGMSQLKVVAFGLPVCMAVVLFHFVLADRIAPSSERAFIEWWEPLINRSGKVWLRNGNNIAKIGQISEDATEIRNIGIFQRDDSGRLGNRLWAESARFEDSQWTLYNVREIDITAPGASPPPREQLSWPNGPEPQVILDLVAPPDQLSKGTLADILKATWSAGAEPSVYSTELARRYVGPLTSLVMMLLAASAIRGQTRTGGPQLGAAIALALGLTFLVVEGMFAALGKAGILMPVFAAWAPLLMFTGIAGLILYRFER